MTVVRLHMRALGNAKVFGYWLCWLGIAKGGKSRCEIRRIFFPCFFLFSLLLGEAITLFATRVNEHVRTLCGVKGRRRIE